MLPRHIPLALSLCALAACADLTAPGSRITPQPEEQSADEEEPEAKAAPTPVPAQPVAEGETVRASHVLVSYKGATRANPEVSRTKDEAKKRAEEVAVRARKGEDFAKLAQDMSDGPTGPRGGDLGSFSRERMVKPFADAAFELKPGDVSGVVETPFGFHVIKRTE